MDTSMERTVTERRKTGQIGKLVCVFSVIMLMAAAFVLCSAKPASAVAASGTVSMKGYNEVLKRGKYAYCAASGRVYRVNVKTGKKLLIYKNDPPSPSHYSGMKWYKGSLYFIEHSGGTDSFLIRAKYNSAKGKFKAEALEKVYQRSSINEGPGGVAAYAIKNNKLYCKAVYGYEGSRVTHNRVLNLKTGKVSSTGKTIILKEKNSNKKGYKIINKLDTAKHYLKKPSGKKIYLYKTTFPWGA